MRWIWAVVKLERALSSANHHCHGFLLSLGVNASSSVVLRSGLLRSVDILDGCRLRLSGVANLEGEMSSVEQCRYR